MTNTEKQKALKEAIKDLQSTFKNTSIDLLPNIAEANVEKVSTGSLMLDSIIGGGLPVGRLIEIYGSEASGKTSIALTTIGNVQKNGGNALFIDVEQAFDPNYSRKLGVDTSKLVFCQPIIAEDILNMVNRACQSGVFDIIVIDSVAAMVPKQEFLNEDFEKASIGLVARLMSKALRQIAANAHKSNTTVIFLNQTRANVGVMYGPSTVTSGGNALKFYCSQRIEVKRKQKVEEDGEVIGNEVHLKCVKNKVSPPFGEADTVLTYNKGINKAAELMRLAEHFNIIRKAGRTYYCDLDNSIDVNNFGSTIVDGQIKIGVNAKPVLQEIEMNTSLYDFLANKTISILNSKNGLSEDDEEEIESEDFEEI